MTKDTGHFEIFPERDTTMDRKPTGEYCWRFVAANGQIVATGHESFTSTEHTNRAIHGFIALVSGGDPHPPIHEVDV